MSNKYQVVARKYRPKNFGEILGQDAIVATLKNAIKQKRLAHAYLFCGSRGTGKTTLARVMAKALNCLHPTDDGEPCSVCTFCKEIASGGSMDVLEIDGASHRGIDDIRQINETVGYAASSGRYKIYIIDEVHMLTKEAFNALLKTLEEPPEKVVFIFATTEPHKVLPTILSRCQRFNLNRIPLPLIMEKLSGVAKDLGVTIDEEALRLLATRAEGGLRDAESLLDQVIAFQEGQITAEDVASILGIMPREIYFQLDKAGKGGDLAIAFEIAHQVFSEGKDILHFIEGLTEHFRHLLYVKLSNKDTALMVMSDEEREKYLLSASLYTQEQCLTILDYLIEAQNTMRHTLSSRFALEAILLYILKVHQRVPIDILIRKLEDLEQQIKKGGNASAPVQQPAPTPAPVAHKEEPQPKKEPLPPAPASPPPPKPEAAAPPKEKTKPAAPPPPPIEEDPTPSPADLGIHTPPNLSKQSRHDTIMQFAAVEFEGKLEKKLKR